MKNGSNYEILGSCSCVILNFGIALRVLDQRIGLKPQYFVTLLDMALILHA